MLYLFFYRVLTQLLSPFLVLWLCYRCLRGKEDRARLKERLGMASRARPQGDLIWIHAASVGESLSILPLIEYEQSKRPELQWLLTTGTVSAAKLMANKLPEKVAHQFIPVDTPSAMARFLNHWKPQLALLVESEIWPNMVMQAARKCPVIVINGRISDHSFKRWKKMRRISCALFHNISAVFAQSDEDAEKYKALGAAHVTYAGNMKWAAAPLSVQQEALKFMRRAIEGRRIIIAASTHHNEELIIARIAERLRQSFPSLLTIIVPRHSYRAEEITQLLEPYSSTKIKRRSVEMLPSHETQIFIGDTMGELGLFYRLAEVVFVGGSLIPHGGQNPLEPVRLGCVTLQGPHSFNFNAITEELVTGEALKVIADEATLEQALHHLLQDENARAQMQHNARRIAETKHTIITNYDQLLSPFLLEKKQ